MENTVLQNIANSIKEKAVTHTGYIDDDVMINDEEIVLAATEPYELAEKLSKFLPTYNSKLTSHQLGLVFYRQTFMVEYLSDEGMYAIHIDRERLDKFLD